MAAFEQLLTAVAWVAIALLGAVLALRGWQGWRHWPRRRALHRAGALRGALHLLAIIGLGVLAFGLLHYLFVLQRGTTFMPWTLKLALSAVLLAWLLLEAVLLLRPLPSVRWPAWLRTVLGTLACWALALPLLLVWLAASRYPAAGEGVLLALPFEGEWVAIGAGASARTNHHHRLASQRYALDIARSCGDGRLFRGQGQALEESCTFGAPLLSPANGVVVHASDDLPDQGRRDVLPGNHVVIALDGGGGYVALAHLQHGSVAVAVGERVAVGQPIGRAGNSGNSDFPHLHIHVQDGPAYDIERSVSIPFRFARAEVKRFLWWREREAVALLSNERVRPPNGNGQALHAP